MNGTDESIMPTLLVQFAFGAVAFMCTVIVHAVFMVTAVRQFRKRFDDAADRLFYNEAVIVAVIIWFFLSICVQCFLWACLFLFVDALDSFEAALYFTVVTYTTLGYGDIVLSNNWRLLGAFAATNGTIIVGWTTALVFVAIQRIYRVGSRR